MQELHGMDTQSHIYTCTLCMQLAMCLAMKLCMLKLKARADSSSQVLSPCMQHTKLQFTSSLLLQVHLLYSI